MQLIEEFAESERLEQLTAEKRRIKILEYRRTVNAMLEERRRRRAEELQYLLHVHQLDLEEEKARYQDVLFTRSSSSNDKLNYRDIIICLTKICGLVHLNLVLWHSVCLNWSISVPAQNLIFVRDRRSAIFVTCSRKRMIEEERLRMLKEHASRLIGYLPRGVLREDDLPHLGSEFMKHYAETVESSSKCLE